jgi:hypothetical protein
MWEDAVVACLKVLSQYLPDGTEKSWRFSDISMGGDSKPRLPEYEA